MMPELTGETDTEGNHHQTACLLLVTEKVAAGHSASLLACVMLRPC